MADEDTSDVQATRTLLIGRAVSVAIFPPWRIPVFEKQVRASIYIITIGGVLVAASRYFAPFTEPWVSGTDLLIDFGVAAVPVLVGILVGFFAPRMESTSIPRWTNFVGVSFFYTLIIVLLAIEVLPSLLGMTSNPIDDIRRPLGVSLNGALWALSFLAAMFAVFIMYLRKRLWFRTVPADAAWRLAVAFCFCSSALALLTYYSVFFNWT